MVGGSERDPDDDLRRQREVAIRMSVGATRARLIRQLVTESLLVSAAGGMLALPVAWAARRLLPFGHTNPFDWRVFAFAGGLSLAAGVAFSLVPALRATRAEPSRALKEQSRSVTLSRSRLRPGPDRGPSGGVAGAARRRRALPEDPGQPAGRRRRIQPGLGVRAEISS